MEGQLIYFAFTSRTCKVTFCESKCDSLKDSDLFAKILKKIVLERELFITLTYRKPNTVHVASLAARCLAFGYSGLAVWAPNFGPRTLPPR